MQKQKIYMKDSKIRCNQPWVYCVTDVLSCVSNKTSLTIAIWELYLVERVKDRSIGCNVR